MKKLITMVLMLLPMIALGQGTTDFILSPEGSYTTKGGNDYEIITFDDKSAEDIYKMLMTGISGCYNNPDKVIVANVPGSLLKIRAYSDDLARAKPFGYGKDQSWEGYYQLEFRIKDGRVRVSAPYIEDDLVFYSRDRSPEHKSFRKIAKGYFKNGEIKEKKRSGCEFIAGKINYIINKILNNAALENSDDDW